MFKDFIDTQDFLRLPISGNGIFINKDGIITDNNNTIIKTYSENNELYVKLDWIKGYTSYPVSLLIAFTFKPVYLSIKEWHKLDLLYSDKNKQNIHPSNLIWKFPKDGIKCKTIPGFYYIPGYTRYVINKEGHVRNTLTNKECKPYKTFRGYVKVTIVNDVTGKKNLMSVHRLMAITFLEYDEYVDFNHVNHIDNNKLNNRITNLEWCTAKQNVYHSFTNGDRKKPKEYSNKNVRRVLVKNVLTGIITEYRTRYDCSKRLNIDKDKITSLLNLKEQPIHKGCFQFKYLDDPEPWRIIENVEKEILLSNKLKKVLVRNIETKEVKEFDSQKECAKFYNLLDSVVSNRIKTKGQVLFPGGLQFKLKSEETDWKDFSFIEEEIRKYDNTKGVLVRNTITGEIKEYYSCIECCKDLNLKPSILNWRLTKKGQITYPGNLQFKYKNDSTPWSTNINLDNKIKKSIKVTNLETKEEKDYSSLRKCSLELNIHTTIIIKNANNKTCYKGLLFSYN